LPFDFRLDFIERRFHHITEIGDDARSRFLFLPLLFRFLSFFGSKEVADSAFLVVHVSIS